MSEFKLTTPVAFIIFNRPDTTSRVFSEIAKAKPEKLLVIGDGPRSSRPGEIERVAEVREIINKVDWPCEVLTNFSEKNLGCKLRVSSGIDWLFEQVEEAIILEDDCLPDPTFFQFCQEMLDRYRFDKRIGMISGDNFQFGRCYQQDSYYFSRHVHIWGWATWRSRWKDSYDVNMKKWPKIRDDGLLSDMPIGKRQILYWTNIFNKVYEGQVDTWDYQWGFANMIEGRVSILPSINLISNIGFGNSATHTISESNLANLPIEPMVFPLKHPVCFLSNNRADSYTDQVCYQMTIWKRVLNKLNRFF